MDPISAQQLCEAQNAPADEFGVTHHDIFYSEEDNRIWCVLDAPSKEAVKKHHAKVGISCHSIHEVKSTRG